MGRRITIRGTFGRFDLVSYNDLTGWIDADKK